MISKVANLINMTAETPDSSHRCASSIAGGLQRQAGCSVGIESPHTRRTFTSMWGRST
nr:hypothetical protein JVH1_9180 [Rhodococcus sp. JVH1]